MFRISELLKIFQKIFQSKHSKTIKMNPTKYLAMQNGRFWQKTIGAVFPLSSILARSYSKPLHEPQSADDPDLAADKEVGKPVSDRVMAFRNKLRAKVPMDKLEQGFDHPNAELEPLERWPNGVNPHTGEVGGPAGPEPTRYGDWERKGRCIDF